MQLVYGVLVGFLCVGQPDPTKSNNEGKIVGKWQCTDAGGIVPPGVDLKVEFTAKGKMIMTFKGGVGEESISADYELGKGDRVTFTNFSRPLPGGQKQARDEITIKGDEMTMKEPDGKIMKFKRM
jgi:uncharacterized protein (TIGR03066 family)